ncbi:alpha-amylase family glycosyl hydrolase [Brachybacterium phenoliresistens]|uniref:alpha-amylase family glycosyl hydrolase n=1 Tax=Brachybacterium phenoliresistens TaxID=396014 RepID=UPI0031DDFFC0
MSPGRSRGSGGAEGRRSTRPADRSDLWWRTAVIYCLDIETFQDSDGDGVGDIDGLADRIEYLASLGVTCLWLMPFQRTEDLDDGYDVTDHLGVDERLGDLGRFVEILRVAHDRGLRVIIDLVINHTSDQHPWFLSARSSRESPFRDYYVWRDEVPEDPGNSVFPGQEDGIWEYDRATEQYYLHNFYRHQPDLNLAEPRVREEIARILGFWLQLGVDGFRIDAVPFLVEEPGAPDGQDPHAFLREMHRFVRRRCGEAALLGEVGLPHQEQLEYFGDGGVELDLQLDFLTAQTVFLAMAREDAAPLARVLADRPVVDAAQGWAMFLRNHDELTLELLGEGPMQEVFEAFAPDPRRRVFDRGIVRRLAPMLENDPRRLRLAYSLLFSLPGAPVLYFGEEIGMGEPEDTDDRGGMRTPMQWEAGPTGGFSGAPREELPTPPTGGELGPDRVNVRDQLRDPESLLSYIRRLIAQYRSTPEIAWGELRVLDVSPASVLAHASVSAGAAFLAVHNLSAQPCTVRVPVGEIVGEDACFEDLLAPTEGPSAAGGQITLALEAYGHRWLRAADLDPAP